MERRVMALRNVRRALGVLCSALTWGCVEPKQAPVQHPNAGQDPECTDMVGGADAGYDYFPYSCDPDQQPHPGMRIRR